MTWRSLRGYFDTRAVPEQLGLQVLVQPREIGPFSFGYSVAVHSGRASRPGAFSITVLRSNDEEAAQIRALSRQTAGEMLGMEGFIGATLARVGDVNLTVSAWEQPDNPKQLMRGGTHAEAMREFWAGLGESGYTSV
jgi:heme-degrading monooxygenase HmoA